MEARIGPCILSQRTPYSKYRLFDFETHEDVTEKAKEIFDKLIKDYEIQKNFKEDYFKISLDTLIQFLPENSDNIKYAFIPENIKKIEEEAFKGAKISYVSFPSSLKTIEDFAFWKCTSLRFIEIPDTIPVLGIGAFAGCLNLSQIILSKEIESINSQTFMNCYSLSSIIIPNKVETIGPNAFKNCTNLKNIKFGTNVQTLNSFAFLGCESLINVNLPASIKCIREKCFGNCYNLEKIMFPDNIYQLYGDIFEGCDRLKEINIPKRLNSIVGAPFANSGITSLIFNHNLEKLYILDCDLISKSHINKLIINSNVEKITPDAFKYSGKNITEIEYKGTKAQFNNFKESNKALFKKMPNLTHINFLKETSKDVQIKIEER